MINKEELLTDDEISSAVIVGADVRASMFHGQPGKEEGEEKEGESASCTRKSPKPRFRLSTTYTSSPSCVVIFRKRASLL